MLNEKSIDGLSKLLQETTQITHGGDLSMQRSRFELIDKYLQKESDRTPGGVKGQLMNELGDKSKIRDAEVPIVFIQKETALAFMTATFLSGTPAFAVVSDREHEAQAEMMTALVMRDQTRFNWVGNLLESFDDVLRYNVMAVETLWATKRATSVQTRTTAGSPVTGVASPVTYEGNSLRRLDPYNLILDPLVHPAKVHEEGRFAGYVERLTYINLRRRFYEWNDTYIVKKHIRPAFNSKFRGDVFFQPLIRKFTHLAAGQDTNWGSFFGSTSTVDLSNADGTYEVITLYSRIIPRDYGVQVPSPKSPQIFKLVWVNGFLLYAEPIQSGHEYLSIVVGQLYAGNLEVKSFSEYLMDLQDLSTSMIKGTMDSMRRAVADRGLYDPTRIRKQDVESTSPVAKIPVTTNTYQQGLENAYRPIPYEDRISPLFNNNLQLMFSLADQTTGQNRAAQGNFIRGNKTALEFDTIMSKSDSRMQLGALQLEYSFFQPLKEIVKINYLVYASNETINDGQNGQPVKIDPVLLREYAPNFRMADGIMPSTKIASTEVLVQAIQYFSSHPELSMEYNTGAMIVSMLKQQGALGLDNYKRTPEEMQMAMQRMQALQGGGKEEAGAEETGQ